VHEREPREFAVKRPLAALLVLSLAACTTTASGGRIANTMPALNDLTSFALMRADLRDRAPSAISVDEAADLLKDYDVIFLGEWHDHPGNHLAQMALFRAIHQRAPRLALSMEQFERDVQPVVDDYMAGRIGEENLRSRGRAWSNYAESYRPLVEYAKEHELHIIAAEAPTRVVRCVGQEGAEFLSHLGPEQRRWAAAELHLGDSPYRDKFLRFLAEDGAHGQGGASEAAGPGAGPSQAALRSFAAQVTRDDTMAESIYLHLQKNPGAKVVHLTGAFHVEGFMGTVERLKLRAPGLKIAVVAPVEIEHPEHPSIASADATAGNFVLLLRSLPKSYVSDAEMNAAMAEQQTGFAVRKCDL
jgi:uncharacterized iron-regulated protein